MINKSKSNPKHNIAKNLQKLRRDKNLSQNDLSRETGLSVNIIAKIEVGISKNPTISTLLRITQALGKNMEDLLK